MQDTKAILIPEGTYHIYNRANGNESLFFREDNYLYFLEKYKEYISPVAETFCYCLMPNHFHFLIRIKSENELRDPFKIAESNLTGFENLSGLLSKKFSDLFNAYSKAINKQQNRKGSLFMRPFKRKRVTDEIYLRKLVHYIHYNPVSGGLAERPEQWKHSSFKNITENQPGFILKNEVIEMFDDIGNFIYCHKLPAKETGIEI